MTITPVSRFSILLWSVTLLSLTSASMAESSAEADLAEKQWATYYEFRKASATAVCAVVSLEADVQVHLQERGGSKIHAVKIGSDVYPGTEAWIRIDDREPMSFEDGLVPSEASFALVTNMLVGGYVNVEWSEWPSHSVQQEQSGLGFFAWAYSICRAKLGWGVPDSLQSILEKRYQDGPDLELPEVTLDGTIPDRSKMSREPNF